MPRPDLDLPQVYVQPGESHLVTEPAVIRTVLGSCVGITFWAPRLGAGGLCHPMLPSCPPKSNANTSPTGSRRYVDFTIRDMARQFDAMGARRGEVLVKLFGGADVLPVSGHSKRATVGTLNSEAASRVLREEGFDVVASRLGGDCGINIVFNTGTGEVLLRKLG